MITNSIASELRLLSQLQSWLSSLLHPRGDKHKVWCRNVVVSHFTTKAKCAAVVLLSPLPGRTSGFHWKHVGWLSLPAFQRRPAPLGLRFSHKNRTIILPHIQLMEGSTCDGSSAQTSAPRRSLGILLLLNASHSCYLISDKAAATLGNKQELLILLTVCHIRTFKF